MMTKENTLFAIIGLLVGLITGFVTANSINQSAVVQPVPGLQAPGQQAAGLPAGHPSVPGSQGGSIPEVQAAIEKAKADPKDFEAQMKAAELYYQIQRFDGAIEYLKKANELQPENYEVMLNLGNANFDAGKYDEAEKWYTTALTKRPDDGDARTDLGLTFIFRSSPDYDRAVQEFQRVLDANPNHVQALQNLTVAYTKKADAANAAATFARLEQIDAANGALPQLREELQKLQNK